VTGSDGEVVAVTGRFDGSPSALARPADMGVAVVAGPFEGEVAYR
jgi:hypothetical protein